MPSEGTQVDYVQRTNLALDYIVRNLDGQLRLEDVAAAASFSPFHFHRIFKSLLGETLNQFIKRQRLERALYLMSHAPGRSLTEIAHECGFSSLDFSRSFKQRYDIAPSAFDLDAFRDSRRADYEAALVGAGGAPHLPRLPKGQNPDNFQVKLRNLPARKVVYIRVLDPFRDGAVTGAIERLLAWAEERGLADGQWLGYMWEDPEIVAIKDCRYDVALVIEDDLMPDGEIGRFDFPPMGVAEVTVKGSIELEQRAIDWLFGTWLPSSGYEAGDQPAFEAWIGRPFAHGFEHFELLCHLPLRG